MKHPRGHMLTALLAAALIFISAPAAHGALCKPLVTKDPAGEAVNEWESAVFIARASGAALFAWRLVSPDGSTLYSAAAAPEYFPGLRTEGADTDTLTLFDIPYTLNGWQAECLFTDASGEKALSARAALTVYPVGPTPEPEVTPTPESPAAPEITPTTEPTPTPGVSPTPDVSPTPEPAQEPTAAAEITAASDTPVPTATAAPEKGRSAPVSRRAVLGLFAVIVAAALGLGALSLALRGGGSGRKNRRR